MKVLYFTPFYPPQGEAAATRAYWFVKVLKEAGHTVSVLNASDFSFRVASNKDRALKRLIRENLTGIELFFKILTSRHDILVLSSPPFFSVIWGAFAAILSKQKYILDVRDLYPEIFFELGMIKKESTFGIFAQKITRFMYKRAQGVMTVTQGLCNEIEEYQVIKPSLVMNGYDSDLFFPGSLKEKFEKFTLVFHGTLGKVQNINTLLKLAKELEDENIDIVIAGEGPKAQEIVEANMKNIRFLGNIPYSEIPSLLRKCHLGLSFRTDDKIGKEAFPVKVFEYVGCGIPVILAPKGEAGSMIEGLQLGLEFDNSQIWEMKKAILELKEEGNFNSKSSAQFTRETQARKILGLLQ